MRHDGSGWDIIYDVNKFISGADLNALYELETAAACGRGDGIGTAGVVIHEADSPIVFLVNNFVCLSVFCCGLRLKNNAFFTTSETIFCLSFIFLSEYPMCRGHSRHFVPRHTCSRFRFSSASLNSFCRFIQKLSSQSGFGMSGIRGKKSTRAL